MIRNTWRQSQDVRENNYPGQNRDGRNVATGGQDTRQPTNMNIQSATNGRQPANNNLQTAIDGRINSQDVTLGVVGGQTSSNPTSNNPQAGISTYIGLQGASGSQQPNTEQRQSAQSQPVNSYKGNRQVEPQQGNRAFQGQQQW